MRVLYIENTPGFGGSLTGLLELIDHMPSEIEPILVSSFDVLPYVDLSNRIKYECVNIPQPPLVHSGIVRGLMTYYQKSFRPWDKALDRIVRREKPDVIHANNGCLINLASAFVGKRNRIPTISHQKCFEYDGKLNRLLLRKTRYTHHIGTSPAISKHLVKLGLDPAKLSTTFEPIRAPANWTPPVDVSPIRIGMYSMITPWKGQDVFLDAIGLLSKRDVPLFRAVLAGSAPDGDTIFPAELNQQIDRLGIGKLVEQKGQVKDMYGLLNQTEIAVHASVKPEPFGRVVAEAMICGLPVVVSDAGGPGEYVEHGVTGFCTPLRNAAALADALEKLLVSADLRRKMGLAGREYALRMFDPTRLAHEMSDLYKRLCKKA